MKILAIGNSFSEDAMRYLHEIAVAGGKDVQTVNLYIGGCSMETHWNNIVNEAPLYMYQKNGQLSDRYVSIQEALDEQEWDIITCQQRGHIVALVVQIFGVISKSGCKQYIADFLPIQL